MKTMVASEARAAKTSGPRTWRAALIGCGMIGSEYAADTSLGIYTHAGAYAAHPGTTLVAVCDRDRYRADQCGDHWQIAARYDDPVKMMKIEKPEIVSVCTPDATHVEIASLVLNSPGVCAVLLEKPLAPTVCEAEKILTLARQRGVVLAVNYSRRYAEGHVRLQKFVREGGIGEIVTIGGIYTKGTLHNGTHWFDAVRWLAGEITRVRGFDLRREPGNDPTLDAILEFENGASAHLQAADATVATVFEMDLVGTRGRVRIVHSGLNIEVFHVADSDQFAGHRVMVPGESFPSGGDWLLHAVSDLVSCLEEDRAPRCSGENALAALRIALAVRKSAATGCPVKPTEIA